MGRWGALLHEINALLHEINALLHEIGVKGRFHRGFLLDGGVVGSDGCGVDGLSDDYPIGANSIGSSPPSSRV